MKTPASILARWRFMSTALGICGSLAVLFFSGCATMVPVTSSPVGAAVTAGGKSIGATPTQYQVDTPNKPVEFYFSLPGYFSKAISYTAGSTPQPISVSLEPTKLARTYEINSEPAGAAVTLDGRPVGTTPVTMPVEFTRDSENAPWTPQRIVVTKNNYQSEAFVLTSNVSSVPTVPLSLLKDDRVYTITATNLEGAVLHAPVTLDGKPTGLTTPAKLPITFQRSDKSRPWPRFTALVEIPGQYKPAVVELNYVRDVSVALRLEAITEITAKIYAPEVAMTPVGAAFRLSERSVVATLRTGDESTAITDLKQVTKFDRQDMRPSNRLETISAFTITPDGQNVVFALTDADENGNQYSNLFIKRADDVSGGVSRLTQGARYFDAQPFLANDGSNYLVFTSNRGDRSKADVFRVNLVENRLSGGVSRLTNDNRFNYLPTYGDSNRQLFYLSVEPAFPKAEVQLSSIRFDGSLPTQLPIAADQINNSHPEKVFFVKVDPDTKKQQIYSVTPDGKLETALINQEDFKKANCFQPYASADGQRVLFVSDHTSDPKDRANNNVFVINADGTNLLQLTFNESDDVQPIWSPAEEGVVYFLSTRGGAPNIWRFKLVTGR
jgi:hypothetical protein